MKKEDIGKVVFILFLGQLVSLFLAVNSFTSSLIADLGVDTPLTQSFFTYSSLARLWHHFLVSSPKATVNKAYQYSSITSVTLLDCWTIPWVIILTWMVLGTRYSLWQFLGAAICVVGLGVVLLSDAGVSGGGGTKRLLGDALVIAGTLFYAFSNVGEEFCVKKKDRVEVLMMLGVFGMLVSLFVCFAVGAFLFYTVVPFVMKMSGSTLFNLSLLTSDMWAVLIRIFFYRQEVDWLYYLAFGVVAVGLITYSVNETGFSNETAIGNEEVSIPYEPLNEENPASRNVAILN